MTLISGIVDNQENVGDLNLKNGLFVIEPSRGESSLLCGPLEDTGDDVKVTKPETEPRA